MSAFMPSFFQVKKPRSFEYKPRYYKMEEERLFYSRKEQKEMGNNNESSYRERIREGLERQRPKRKTKGLLTGRKLLICLLIVALIILYVYCK